MGTDLFSTVVPCKIQGIFVFEEVFPDGLFPVTKINLSRVLISGPAGK
jgi:hypothetical protein